MDVFTREELLANHAKYINMAICNNMTVIRALRLEEDDVYQELAIAFLNAIDRVCPSQSVSIEVHIESELQKAFTGIRAAYRPYGMTGVRDEYVSIASVKSFYDSNIQTEASYDEDFSTIELSEAVTLLSDAERKAVHECFAGVRPRKKSQRDTLMSARRKLMDYFYEGCFC